MDIIGNLDDYRATIEQQIELSKEYARHRKVAGGSKQALDILLAAEFKTIRETKPNVGYDLAIVMLIEKNETAKTYYKDLIIAESQYKGIEKILEALQNKTSFAQSLMKYVKDNT
jgi:hypothetical protein